MKSGAGGLWESIKKTNICMADYCNSLLGCKMPKMFLSHWMQGA